MGRKAKNHETGNLIEKQCACGRTERVDEACETVVCCACLQKQTFPQEEIDRVNGVKPETKEAPKKRGRPKGSKNAGTKVKKAVATRKAAGKRGRKISAVGKCTVQYLTENRGRSVHIDEILPVYIEARKTEGKYSGDQDTEFRNLNSTLYSQAKKGLVKVVAKKTYTIE